MTVFGQIEVRFIVGLQDGLWSDSRFGKELRCVTDASKTVKNRPRLRDVSVDKGSLIGCMHLHQALSYPFLNFFFQTTAMYFRHFWMFFKQVEV